jgi:hypothetical protein
LQAHDHHGGGGGGGCPGGSRPGQRVDATQSVRSFIFPVKATTTVRTQASGNGGIWATVRVQRTATVSGGAPVLPFHCGPRRQPVLRLLRGRQGHRLVPHVPVRPDAVPVHSGPAHQERRHRPGGRVLLVRVLRQHRTQVVHRAPVLLRAVLRRGRLAEAVLPVRYQVQPVLITGYQVTYGAWTRCGPQRWIDSSTNGHGSLPFDGNIRGC